LLELAALLKFLLQDVLELSREVAHHRIPLTFPILLLLLHASLCFGPDCLKLLLLHLQLLLLLADGGVELLHVVLQSADFLLVQVEFFIEEGLFLVGL
jgi:hypothetical protein